MDAPKWKMTLANKVTLFRTCLIPIIIALLFGGRIYFSLIIFVIFLVGDLVDGVLARKRDEVTLIGKFLDPLSDKLLVGSLLFSFAWIETYHFSWWPFILLAVQQLGLLAGTLLLFNKRRPISSSRYLGKSAAAILSLGIIFTFLTLPFYREIIYAGIAVSYLAGLDYFRITLKSQVIQTN